MHLLRHTLPRVTAQSRHWPGADVSAPPSGGAHQTGQPGQTGNAYCTHPTFQALMENTAARNALENGLFQGYDDSVRHSLHVLVGLYPQGHLQTGHLRRIEHPTIEQLQSRLRQGPVQFVTSARPTPDTEVGEQYPVHATVLLGSVPLLAPGLERQSYALCLDYDDLQSGPATEALRAHYATRLRERAHRSGEDVSTHSLSLLTPEEIGEFNRRLRGDAGAVQNVLQGHVHLMPLERLVAASTPAATAARSSGIHMPPAALHYLDQPMSADLRKLCEQLPALMADELQRNPAVVLPV